MGVKREGFRCYEVPKEKEAKGIELRSKVAIHVPAGITREAVAEKTHEAIGFSISPR